MRCVICGEPVPQVRVEVLRRAEEVYVVSRGKWTVEGSATCSVECNRERKRRFMNARAAKLREVRG